MFRNIKKERRSTVVVVELLCIVMIAEAAPAQDILKWIQGRFKMYEDEAYATTIAEYQRKITEHNEKFKRGLVSYSLKINDYSKILHRKFFNNLNGYNHSAKIFGNRKTRTEFVPFAYKTLPIEVDWRISGAITEVKNQGQYCGSCWAFSLIGALEGQYYRKTGKLVSLSAQNLIDCSGAYGTSGCDGGLMDDAFEYIKDNGGIDTEEYYPYQGEQSECRYNPQYSATSLAEVVDLPPGDEAQLMAAVAEVGPVSVAVDASLMTFQSYSHGVYYDPDCSSAKPNHAMLVVGYGSDAQDGDYWLVKNSWGESWGMQGYMKLARNRDNHCGVATVASYPVI